jgi:hypothetical protein
VSQKSRYYVGLLRQPFGLTIATGLDGLLGRRLNIDLIENQHGVLRSRSQIK